MNNTDIIVLSILIFYFISGIRKGFLRTLIGPIALIVGTVFAIIFYQQTENFLWALLISILAPLSLNLFLLIILKILHKTFKKDKPISTASRISGGLTAVLWSGAWTLLTLIFLVITPCEWNWFDKLQNDILDSKTYAAINTLIGDKIPDASMNVHEISEMLQNPRKFRAVRNTDEYKELANDDVILDLLNDKTTMEQIEHQNIPKLLSNPKFQALLQDKDLIKKVFALQRKLTELEEEKLENN